MVADGPQAPEHGFDFLTLVQQEIRDLTAGEFDVRFPPDKHIEGDWTLAGVGEGLQRLLADPQVDVVLTLGVLASQVAALLPDPGKPIIAPFILDVEAQGVPYKDGASGVKNLVYIVVPSTLVRDLKMFREIAPFTQVTFLVSDSLGEFVAELHDNLSQVLDDLGVTVQVATVGDSATAALAKLPPDTQAVYLAPLMKLPPAEWERLIAGLIARRIPTFSLEGERMVKKGVLAGLAPESDLPRVARRVALDLQRILLGEKAGTIPVDFSREEQLFINVGTMLAVGIAPDFPTLTEAELINLEATMAPRLSFADAVYEAVLSNLQLAAAGRQVAAGGQRVRQTLAPLLPQVELRTEGALIDEDSAAASFGAQAERTLTGTASLRQILYDEDTWAAFQVERFAQTRREQDRESLRLDVTQLAAIAYLDVLRARTLQRVQAENLKLTRSNLSLAEVRLAVGTASRAEVYRWESQIATDRQAVVDAHAQHNNAKTALNRVLNRPLGQDFDTEEVGLDYPLLLSSDGRLRRYLDNPWTLYALTDFMVREGLAASPELRAFEAAIAAQERTLLAAQRAYWAPSVSLSGEVTDLFAEGGAGSGALRLDGGVPVDIPQADDLSWVLGFRATLPIFAGGGRFATTARAHQELAKVRLDRAASAQRIEEGIRTNLQNTWSSYLNIRLSRDAATAANKNLELVTDSYGRGVVGILDLLDAQNQALNADLAAENAVYDFLVQLMNVERSVSQFDFFMTAESREKWFEGLESFLQEAGPPPGTRLQR